jgi:hypothetical protein
LRLLQARWCSQEHWDWALSATIGLLVDYKCLCFYL